jgi:L-fuconolactonase
MDRRSALKLGLGAAVGLAAEPLAPLPVVDTHIHLFDTRRPGGVPWPEKTDEIYLPALPPRYAGISKPFGVVGAIAVEASPLKGDNDWVLQLIGQHPLIVGFVGDLIPGSPSFAADLDRLRANPLFLGIRCGNLWNRDLSVDAKNPAFIADLHRLASAGLEMDSANPDANLIGAILRISQQIPELRIVIDHLPHAALPAQADALREYRANLEELGLNSRVFVKLSEIPVRDGGRLVTEASRYEEKLDAIWDVFGEDRILFGSDWPNSDHVANFAETFGIVSRYVARKGPAARKKFYAKNSVAAYRWRPRDAAQGRI